MIRSATRSAARSPASSTRPTASSWVGNAAAGSRGVSCDRLARPGSNSGIFTKFQEVGPSAFGAVVAAAPASPTRRLPGALPRKGVARWPVDFAGGLAVTFVCVFATCVNTHPGATAALLDRLRQHRRGQPGRTLWLAEHGLWGGAQSYWRLERFATRQLSW